MADYVKAAKRAAAKYGVDQQVFLSMIRQESGFNPTAKSPAGAQGIAQFMPGTAQSYGVNLNDNRVTDDLEGAARYIRDNLQRTGGNYHQALSIYNSGRPDGYKSIPETANYVRSILSGTGGASAPTAEAAKSSGSRSVTTSKTTPGVDNSAARRGLILQFLQQRHNPQALVGLASGLQDAQDTPSKTVKVTRHVSTLPSGHDHGKLATIDGKQVSAWIKPVLEYARARGWKGTVTSGFRNPAQQAQAAANFGLQHYGAGGPQASNHTKTGFLQGAIDVTDPETLNRILKAKHSRLQWAGGVDPVHFSVHRNGSY